MSHPATQPGFASALERGVTLFNEMKFFEAHDVWEDQWRLESGEPRLFLQALIQVAAGFVKLQRKSPRGAALNLEKGAEKLAVLGPSLYGIDLATLLASVNRWSQTAVAMSVSGHREFDPALLPRLDVHPAGRP
jgi:hypothetical protein